MSKFGYEHLSDAAKRAFGDSWEQYITEFSSEEWDAVAAYISETFHYQGHEPVGLVSVRQFRDIYQGEQDSFKDFELDILAANGVTSDVIDCLGEYFDLDSYVADVADEYYILDTGRGTVWIYSAY